MTKTHFKPPSNLQSFNGVYFEPGPSEPFTTGNVFYVCSLTGVNAAGYGYSPESPFASLDYALSQVANNNDDRIYLMAGHVETLHATGTSTGNGGVFCGATLSNGISIIGLGTGRLRPILNYTTAVGASMNIAASNVYLRNIVFQISVDDITAMVNVTGSDVFFDSCEFQMATGTMSAAIGILTAATATRLRVENSRFLGPATTSGSTCAAAIDHEVGIDYRIVNNEFKLKCTQAIHNTTTVLGGLISNNTFVIGTGTSAITMAAGSTPFIAGNKINVPSGTTPVTAAAGFVAGNAYSAAAGVTAGSALTW